MFVPDFNGLGHSAPATMSQVAVTSFLDGMRGRGSRLSDLPAR